MESKKAGGEAGLIYEAGRCRELNIHRVNKQRLRGDALSGRSVPQGKVGYEEKGEITSWRRNAGLAFGEQSSRR